MSHAPSRRGFLGLVAGLAAGLTSRGASARTPATTPDRLPSDPTRVLGEGITPTSAISPFEALTVHPTGAVSGTAFAPLQAFSGAITPTYVQFQRHHAGIAHVDPGAWKLLVHGLVERPWVIDLPTLLRFPPVTRVHFLECAGNGRRAYRDPVPELTPQQVDGQLANLEWTGVELRRVLAEAGARREARWVVAEGGDAAVFARSVPLAHALDDALLVYAANGEPLRPAHGYPVRLLLPGYEGSACVKWLRRLELTETPLMARDETSRYTDPLPGDRARQFSFVMDAKSIITHPAWPAQLTPGPWPVTGLAWSGRGRIERVDVSTDGGRTWAEADLQGPVTPKAAVRFVHPWSWDGAPALLMSRAVDDTGYVQPTWRRFREVRGVGTDYHFNPIRCWRVGAEGRVTFVADPETP